MKHHSIGIVGYGGFGRFLHDAWSKVERADVVAVADTDPGCDPGDIRFYSAWQDMLNDDEVDVVAIVTPPSTHAAIACAALGRGKHVLVEKPVATTLEDAARIRDRRDESGCVATVDFMLRFNPIVETIREWCRRECFGRLRRVAVENYAQDESLHPNHWFWNREISGGILVEHAVHFFDVVQWCAGSAPAHVDGMTVERTPNQEDRVLAMYAEAKQESFADVPDVSVAELVELRRRGEAIIVDVRSEEERAVSVIPGAMSKGCQLMGAVYLSC